MTRKPPTLSKSRVQSGAQCELKLWYDCFERQLAPPVQPLQQFIFDRGTRIGLLAQERYPGGLEIDAPHNRLRRALEQTKEAMQDSSLPALFEPAFEHEGVSARVDVLVRHDEEVWDLVEVKSATRAKDVYLRDVAIQLWITRGAGVEARRAGLLLLNTDYTYDGERLDLDQLFTFVDMTEEATAMLDEVQELVDRLRETLSRTDPPDIRPGEQCSDPYDCPYIAHCTKGLESPEHPVRELPRIRAKQLTEFADRGVVEISEIPEDIQLSKLHARVRESVISGEEWISDRLAGELAAITYPVYHLDFEAFQPAVPIYAGSRPFEMTPFQYSIHRESDDGTIEHSEFLAAGAEAPHRELAERLIDDLGTHGNICVYSPFEQRIIRDLARRLPDLTQPLEGLSDRLWDLLPIVRNHYYHPGFHGSFSIKRVLPALAPELDYGDMEIADGMMAASMYELALLQEDRAVREKIYDDLRIYCGRDTEAMVALRHALARRAR